MMKYYLILVLILSFLFGCGESIDVSSQYSSNENLSSISSSESSSSLISSTSSSVSSYSRLETKTIFSTILSNTRNIRIYLPINYYNETNSYPVLYMHDGQNIFYPGGPYGCWYVEKAYNNLYSNNLINEFIIVGINNNSDRINEYTPTYDSSENAGGKGSNYVYFIINELIPFINSNYRTLTGPENTALMGSSLGGLISFYAAWNNPDVFGMAGCMSSSFWWDDQNLLKSIDGFTGNKKKIKFWIDSGNSEGSDKTWSTALFHVEGDGATYMAEDAYYMASKLIDLGWTNEVDVLLDIDYTGTHSETAWSKRVFKPLLFFFGKNKNFNITNLKARFSKNKLYIPSQYDSVILFSKAYYDNGMFCEIPLKNLTVTTSNIYNNLYIITNQRIKLLTNFITESTNIIFNVSYKNLQTTLTLYVELLPDVLLNIEVSAPSNDLSNIVMIGNDFRIGAWNFSNSLKLYYKETLNGSNYYTNTIILSSNTTIYFKFCAGNSWDYEELTSTGAIPSDRSFNLTLSTNYYYGNVPKWKSVP